MGNNIELLNQAGFKMPYFKDTLLEIASEGEPG